MSRTIYRVMEKRGRITIPYEFRQQMGFQCVIEGANLIRRLTPLECERLQGFPDYWTDIPDASDSARYKALGNSVAIPCVDFVINGMAAVLRAMP